MAETFYGVLGLEPDADGEAIERAYRERVKEVHPDVADDPDAPREFARLTVARDVLADSDERARYDDLGHAAYVRDHVDASVWATPDPGASGRSPDGSTDGPNGTHTPPGPTGGEGSGGTAASVADGTASAPGERAGTGSTEPGGYGGHGWASAAAYHRAEPTGTGDAGREPAWRRAVAVGRRLGPWLPVHLVLVASAGATAWFGYSGATYLDMAAPGLVVAGLVFVVTLLASALHLLSRAYA